MSYDECLEAPYMRQDATKEEILREDEGMQVLAGARAHLDPIQHIRILGVVDHINPSVMNGLRDSALKNKGGSSTWDEGDILAIDELDTCMDLISASYHCSCGKFLGIKNSYCDSRCYKADQL